MKAIEIIMLPVADQQKAKEFYLKAGLEVQLEAPMGEGKMWLQMGLPNESTSISLMSSNGIIFETDDIEKEVAALNAKGIVTKNIDQTPWGRFCWMNDPDGNEICLHQK